MKYSFPSLYASAAKLFLTTLSCLVLISGVRAQNPCTTSQQNLVAWWKMDDASGTIAIDASGQNHPGQFTNPSWNTFPGWNRPYHAESRAVYLPAEGYMRVPSLAGWQPTAFSVTWWVQPFATYNYNLAVRAMNGWGSFFFHTTDGGAVYVGTDANTRLTPNELPIGTVELTKWQHFAFTYANGVGSLYKDGRLLASRPNMAPPAPWSGFSIGGDPNAGEAPAYGAFDDVRIYNRALAVDEIASLASGVACPVAPVASASPTGDTEYNWTETISYNRQGAEIGSSRQYVDAQGRILQNQVNDHATAQVLASQPIYDGLGRPVITTLPAPINNATFRLKSDFVMSSSAPGQTYGTADFESNPDNPTAVAATSPGTLGWYYSTNNTLEPDVAATGFPYSRTELYADGTAEAKRLSGPGDAFRAGSTHETTNGTFSVLSELDAYAAIRAKYFPTAGNVPTTLKYHGIQVIGINPQGTTRVAVRDEAGHPVMSALPNSSSQAWLQVTNSIALSQTRYSVTAALGQASTIIIRRIEAPTPIAIRVINSANQIVYDGLNTDFNSYGSSRGFNGPITFVADSYFTVDYDQDGYDNLYDQPAVKAQSYAQHQFYLLTPQQITITASAVTASKPAASYRIINLRTSAIVGSGTGTLTFSLPQGFYKLICDAGDITMQYTNAYDQIAFNFYDHRGQLTGSLAPLGAKLLLNELRTTGVLTAYSTASVVPYLTTYEYDIQGNLTARTDPDGGRSMSAYRADSKIRFTQNSKQAVANRFSYVNYDPVGRPIEAGEYTCVGGESFQLISSNSAILENTSATGGLGSRQQFTQMTYDQPVSTGLTGYSQEFVAGRLATSARYENSQPIAKTWFSYDELGRVKWLVKQVSNFPAKTIDYSYNELGTLATVCYQQSAVNERFTHYYTYDVNRRLTKVETNFASPTDQASLRTVQGRYSYYLHGPLKRLEIGDDLQGIDYSYTAQGWLKNINHPNLYHDPGSDGTANNRLPDLFSQSLEYYGAADYNSSRNPYQLSDASITPERYDGNIRAAIWNIQGNPIRGQAFSYTAQNQLAQAAYGLANYTFFGILKLTSDANNRYAEDNLNYDANGNITQMRRTDGAGWSSLDAQYDLVSGTNQLDKLHTGTQLLTQYGYSPVGEVISQTDVASGTAPANDRRFEYDAAGKLKTVSVKIPGSSSFYTLASYSYDEQGYRIKEVVYSTPGNSYSSSFTCYIRDGSGNILSTYYAPSAFSPWQLREQIVYGATRLGVYRRASGNQPAEQLYEHYDHLGNTRVVFRRPTKQTYQLTMEDARVAQEKTDFPDPSSSPGLYDVVRSSGVGHLSSYSISLSSATAAPSSVALTGPTKKLTVGKGDKISIVAYAYYPADIVLTPIPLSKPLLPIMVLGSGLANSRPAAPNEQTLHPTSWQQTLGKLSIGVAIPLVKNSQFVSPLANSTVPNAALRYIFTGADGTTRNGIMSITQDAKNAWQQLTLSTDIDRPGTLEVSVVSYDRTQVYFDDLKIDQQIGPIVQESNFYAYGMSMPELSWSRPDFQKENSGYQGLYAQYDEPTKLNSFQLRMYDARVGRWLSKDPYGQFHSSYTGMGNNPVNGVDPSGGILEKLRAQTSAFVHGGEWGKDEAGGYFSRWDNGSSSEVGAAGHYFGQSESIRSAFGNTGVGRFYNSDAARYAFNDMYSFNVSITGVKGMGGGGTASLVWLTRGPEASVFPKVSTAIGPRIGYDMGVSATRGAGLYTKGSLTRLGPVAEISASSLEGLGADISISGAGLTGGVGVGFNDNNEVTWITGAAGVAADGFGISAGLTKTTVIGSLTPPIFSEIADIIDF